MAPFPAQLLERFREVEPGREPSLTQEDCIRLNRLARLSPLYRNLLLKHPEYLPGVLEEPQEDGENGGLLTEWAAERRTLPEDEAAILARLRTFRRKVSLRIAYREINRLQPVSRSVRELSLLADLAVRECLTLALTRWRSRYGEPWDDAAGSAARFCVMGLGKLGGRELNFSSDIDLIYVYEGEGSCRKNGSPTPFSTAQGFTKVAESLTGFLQEVTEHGFLFRVDLRLRPEGARSPIVRSLTGMENYYAAAGQSWERMALIKARPIAGDLSLGGELLENLHSFRYPRHPPPSLLTEIAAMKLRTEREVVGMANLHRDLKRGLGGIREIEFIVQTMQLLHAGRFPFLQTGSTVEGLEQLTRYRLMVPEESRMLADAYWFLREIEHRLQIREENQTHSLPTDPEQMEAIAESFSFADAAAFEHRLGEIRGEVRSLYEGLLQSSPADEELADWWLYLAESKTAPRVTESLRRWFGPADDARAALQDFLQGSRHNLLTREQVSRFRGLTRTFDAVMPSLAFPVRTLRRISRFADAYGTRSQFLSTCSLDPRFFEIVALLFDRSEFIFDLLCRHPEIVEEVLRPAILRRRKSSAETQREIERAGPAENGGDWLWLYVKAEQIRISIGDFLGFLNQEEAEQDLSRLADAVLHWLLHLVDPQERLLVVALGKYGGAEMSLGSDLDLLFFSDGEHPAEDQAAVRHLLSHLGQGGAGPVFPVDVRLRPHGEDGPLVGTLPGLRRYHARRAQLWEKQILTRARVISGPEPLATGFHSLVDELLYRPESRFSRDTLSPLWEMRLRIERERDVVQPPQRAFKTGPGGLMDLEFLAQILQLKWGSRYPEVRQTSTRGVLAALGQLELVDQGHLETLQENLVFLRHVEVLLRRNRCTPVSIIPEGPEDQHALARWARFRNYPEFWAEHCRAMVATRQIVLATLGEIAAGARRPGERK